MLSISKSDLNIRRCHWCGTDPLYFTYHDTEWGVPEHDDQKLFEMLLLEGFQAGLSWITILRKRENFREAFHGFDPQRIVHYSDNEIERLMSNAGIIRNRAKITGAVKNARAYLDVFEKKGSFTKYLWSFTGGRTLRDPSGMTRERMRATSPESDAMSKDLKSRGFVFVGSTVCYAHMQATGMVDDHIEGCFKYVSRSRRF